MELMRASNLPQPVRQSNLSFSRKGVIRGLHYHERGQSDLFACLQGMVRVVVLDRESGATFTADIGDENPAAVFIPGHHAHGYEALTDCLFLYHVTEEYDADDPDEHGVPWNDQRVVDLWSTTSPILSERDVGYLITGAGGQLGAALREAFPEADARTRAELDVTQPFAVETDLILHAAAWTDVDGAEADPAGAELVNVDGTRNVVAQNVPVVYYSSDYVFDGSKREPYVESDEPNAAVGLRPHEARRRAGSARGLDRPQLVALRLDRHELRADDAAARRRARRGERGRRPARLADLRRPSGRGDARAARRCRGGIWHVPPRASAPGPTSRARSSRTPASTAACARSRPRSSAGRPHGPRTRSCAASARTLRDYRTGARACVPV